MLKRYLDDRGYGSITHSGQDMGTTRMPANGLGKHNAVRLHDDTLLGGRESRHVPRHARSSRTLCEAKRASHHGTGTARPAGPGSLGNRIHRQR